MILLSILKIIGIVLACIVGFVLLLVLLILLIPIRYRLSGDGTNADIDAEGKASWLLGLVSASIGYVKKNVSYRVQIAGIPLKKGTLFDVQGQHEKPKNEDTVFLQEELKEEKKEIKTDEKIEDNTERFAAQTEPISSEKIQKEEKEDKENKEDKADFSDRIERFFERLSQKYEDLIRKKEQAEAILTSKVTGRAVKKVKAQLFHILNHIKPKKIEGNLNFGLEDPANTAIIYGTIDNLVHAMSQGRLILTPEFYQKGISLDMVMQGRILIGYLLVCALRVILNKDVRRVVRVIRRVI